MRHSDPSCWEHTLLSERYLDVDLLQREILTAVSPSNRVAANANCSRLPDRNRTRLEARVTAAARQDLPDLSKRHGTWQTTNVRLLRSRNGHPGIYQSSPDKICAQMREEAFLGFNLAKGRRLAFHGARSNAAIPVLLLDSERRGELAVDAAELGTWRWDLSASEFSGYGRFCALLGLEGAPTGETRSSADRIFALVEPLHCAALASSATECLQRGRSNSVGFPVQSDDRGESWLRAARTAGRHRYP